jgi:hypothetical protein
MKESMKAGVSIYRATPAKYIIFTICLSGATNKALIEEK